MGSIFINKPFVHNKKSVGSFAFGGDTSATMEIALPMTKDKVSAANGIPNYDFLAGDGSLMASGVEFQTANYDAYERVVTLNLGLAASDGGVDGYDTATNG